MLFAHIGKPVLQRAHVHRLHGRPAEETSAAQRWNHQRRVSDGEKATLENGVLRLRIRDASRRSAARVVVAAPARKQTRLRGAEERPPNRTAPFAQSEIAIPLWALPDAAMVLCAAASALLHRRVLPPSEGISTIAATVHRDTRNTQATLRVASKTEKASTLSVIKHLESCIHLSSFNSHLCFSLLCHAHRTRIKQSATFATRWSSRKIWHFVLPSWNTIPVRVSKSTCLDCQKYLFYFSLCLFIFFDNWSWINFHYCHSFDSQILSAINNTQLNSCVV